MTVLGLNARSNEERERFAKLLAIQEFQNTQKIILLDRAYNKAFYELYGHIPVIDPAKIVTAQAKSALLSVPKAQVKAEFGDRYIAFVNTKCQSCNRMVKGLLNSLQLGVSIDIHFDKDSRQQIMSWAASMSISPKSVEAGTITLNPNSSLYEKFGQPRQPSLFYFNKALNKVNEVKL